MKNKMLFWAYRIIGFDNGEPLTVPGFSIAAPSFDESKAAVDQLLPDMAIVLIYENDDIFAVKAEGKWFTLEGEKKQ